MKFEEYLDDSIDNMTKESYIEWRNKSLANQNIPKIKSG